MVSCWDFAFKDLTKIIDKLPHEIIFSISLIFLNCKFYFTLK